MADDDPFWTTTWFNFNHAGGLHPSSPALSSSQSARNSELIRCFREVKRALANPSLPGGLDASKVAVVSHPARLDTWFVRFSNLACPEWASAEVVMWIVFDYLDQRGRGKKIMSFPDAPPLLGVITPTGVFTEKTGGKWLCLPGLAQGFGNEQHVWRTAFSGVVDTAGGKSTFVSNNHQHYVKSTTGHFKKGGHVPVLGSSMVAYIKQLLAQFDTGGWSELDSDEHVDGMTRPNELEKMRRDGALQLILSSSHHYNQAMVVPVPSEYLAASPAQSGAEEEARAMASTVIGEALETPAPVARGVLLHGAAANTADAHETIELTHACATTVKVDPEPDGTDPDPTGGVERGWALNVPLAVVQSVLTADGSAPSTDGSLRRRTRLELTLGGGADGNEAEQARSRPRRAVPAPVWQPGQRISYVFTQNGLDVAIAGTIVGVHAQERRCTVRFDDDGSTPRVEMSKMTRM